MPFVLSVFGLAIVVTICYFVFIMKLYNPHDTP